MSRVDQLLATLNNPSLPGIDLSLERMVRLLNALGDPQDKLPPVIHVAGTNGKGSTIAYLRAIYEAAGKQVHVYTSPHLVRFHERILLSGKEIADDQLERYLERVARAAKGIPATFFEASTAAAFLAFAEHKADVLLLEVGLGGRLDATNVVAEPLATVITPIGIDHTEFLGSTLSGIAAEKAGIIKPGVPCFCAEQPEEVLRMIEAKAKALGAPLCVARRDYLYTRNAQGLLLMWKGQSLQFPHPALLGAHQYGNAALAAVTALESGIAPASVAKGIASAHWPARLQKLTRGSLVDHWRGPVMLDGGHNADAGAALAEWGRTQKQPVSLVVGMMRRKDAGAFLRPLAAVAKAIACVPITGHGDAYDAETLAAEAWKSGFTQVFAASSPAAATEALGNEDGVLLVTGSLFLAGELLKDHA